MDVLSTNGWKYGKMDNTLQRIMEKMSEKHILDREMIEYLGLPKGTFSNWKRDKGKSYYAYIDKIADKLNVSIDYLIRGYEIEKLTLKAQEKTLIDNYRKLTQEGQKVVSANVSLLANGVA